MRLDILLKEKNTKAMQVLKISNRVPQISNRVPRSKKQNFSLKVLREKTFVFIQKVQQIPTLRQSNFDAIVLNDAKLISKIRQDDQLYLKPLFLLNMEKVKADGLFNEYDPSKNIREIERIKYNSNSFLNTPLPKTPEQKLLTKLLRFLLSRNIGLNPTPSRFSNIGYSYKLLEDLSIEKNKLRLLEILKKFTTENYLKTSLVDKVNACYQCEGTYLNFSERCTKCHSMDIKSESLIHHFRCAYVGPEGDFKKDNNLCCPKCDKKLRHIGIDYDKPAEINICNNCTHTTQETNMLAKCVDCEKENELSQLTTHSIYSFQVTEKGREKAGEIPSNEVESRSELEKPNQKTIPPSLFKLFVKHELQKKDIYQNNLYLLDLNISNKVLDKLNQKLRSGLLNELVSITKHYIKTIDLISIQSNSTMQLLLLDYKPELASTMAKTLEYNLDKMLRDNNWASEKSMSVNLREISK